MRWYIRTATTTDATAYDTVESAIGQVRNTLRNQQQRGYQVADDEDGRKVIRDGYELVNTMWVEDEDGNVVRFPYP